METPTETSGREQTLESITFGRTLVNKKRVDEG
jgi:hypothetical protein